MQSTTNDHSEALVAAPLSAVCWGAILAGAAASAALSLILLLLGTGLGLSSVSAWSKEGVSGTTFGLSTILWITLTSLAASAIGGYIAGRLRIRWTARTQSDEIYFRDTAHGFLAWAVATLFTATLLTSAISTVVSGFSQVGASVAGGAATAITASAAGAAATTAGEGKEKSESDDQSTAYFLDALFRSYITETTAPGNAQPASPPVNSGAAKAEVARIYVSAIARGSFPEEDAKYAAQVVSQTTGISEADAQKRVNDTYTSMQKKLADAETAARAAADQARKVTAYGSLWLFISLLIGAFFASWAAIAGGRHGDN